MIIGRIDMVTVLCLLAALVLVIRRGRRELSRDAFYPFLLFLVFCLLVQLSNVLEWTQITTSLDTLEDFTEILLPIFLLFFLYAFQQNHIQNELRQSEQRFRSLVEESLTGVYLIQDDQFRYVNPVMARIFGYTTRELLEERRPQDLTRPEDWPRVQENLRRRLQNEIKSLNYEFRGLTKNGDCIHVEVYGTQTFYRGRSAIIGTLLDVTERKRASQERERILAELETKNAELERFTYTVSHDLKSPLITIKGFLGMLRQDLEDNNAALIQEDMQRITHAAETMESHLDELLDLSRIGRLVNPPECVDPNALIAEVLALLEGDIQRHPVHLEVQPDHPPIYADRLRLREVYQNLIENAVKFRSDRAAARIEIGHRPEAGTTVYFVRDNGAGIEPAYQEKIFGLFEKLDHDSQGSGIGLAIVKRIIEVHGGRIWVESQGAGQGSTFCFTLPGRPESESANEF
ncbi:MAG: PAS domain S-box protein [Sedimentisphaerales bacterium]|nr:PAS domain S-box protein [Sedimentisphaerales bacterium]